MQTLWEIKKEQIKNTGIMEYMFKDEIIDTTKPHPYVLKNYVFNYMLIPCIAGQETINKEVKLDVIERAVTDFYGLRQEILKCNTRKKEVVEARQLVFYFAKEVYKLRYSLAEIAAKYSRDHATCVHSIKTINNYLETDKEFRKNFQIIKQKIDKEMQKLETSTNEVIYLNNTEK